MRRLVGLALLPLMMAALWALRAGAAELLPVRYASIGGATEAGIFIADEYGFFREQGIELSYQRLDNAAALLAAIATGQLDVAGISLTPGLFSSVQQDINLRLVGDKESILPHFAATQFVVRKELAGGSEAEIFRSLKGKTIAISGRTSVSYFLLSLLLKKYAIAPQDVRVVEMVYANMLPAFANGAIDAAVELEPYLSQVVAAGVAKPVSDLTEIVPAHGASIVPIVYGEKFASDRKTADAFMLAYMKAVRIYDDAFIKGIDKDKIIDLVAHRLNFAPQIVRDGNPVGFDPDQEVNAAFLGEAQQFYLEQHMIRAGADLAKLIDPSFAQAAVKALGAYR